MLAVIARAPDAHGTSWLVLAGELDLPGRERLQAEIGTAATGRSVRTLLVDMRELDVIDVTALGTLVVADARLGALGRRLVVIRREAGARPARWPASSS